MDIEHVIQSLSKNKITFPIHANPAYEQSVDYYQRPIKPFIPPNLLDGVGGETDAAETDTPPEEVAVVEAAPTHTLVNMIALAMGMKACKEWVPFLQMSHADMLLAFAKQLRVAIVVQYGPGVYNVWDDAGSAATESIVLAFNKAAGSSWTLVQKKGPRQPVPMYPPLSAAVSTTLKKMVLKDIVPWAEACSVSCVDAQGKKKLKAALVEDMLQHIHSVAP